MTRIHLSPVIDPVTRRVNQYASVSAWLTGKRPVDGVYSSIEPGGGSFIDLAAPDPNSAWYIELRTIDATLKRLVSFSGDSVEWDALTDIDPATLTPLPQNEALAEWQAVLDQLKNYQKTPGPKGDKGDAGDPGIQGPQGGPGIAGPPGDPGAPGTPGAKGDKGDPGTPGTPGAAGPQGIPGTPGATGPQGIPGATGPQGIQGLTGAKGDTGNTGATGATGPQGIPGTTGAQGIQGATGATGAMGPAGADYPHVDSTGTVTGTAPGAISGQIYNGVSFAVVSFKSGSTYSAHYTLLISRNPFNSAAGTVTVIASTSWANTVSQPAPTFSIVSGFLMATFATNPASPVSYLVRMTQMGTSL